MSVKEKNSVTEEENKLDMKGMEKEIREIETKYGKDIASLQEEICDGIAAAVGFAENMSIVFDKFSDSIETQKSDFDTTTLRYFCKMTKEKFETYIEPGDDLFALFKNARFQFEDDQAEEE